MARKKNSSKLHTRAAIIIIVLLIAAIASVALSGINLSRTNRAAPNQLMPYVNPAP